VQWPQQHSLSGSGGGLEVFSPPRRRDRPGACRRDPDIHGSATGDCGGTLIDGYAQPGPGRQPARPGNRRTGLGVSADGLLGLTARIVEAARQVDSKLDLTIGIAQPWGEYMAVEDRTHSPFIFADTLIRSGLTITGLDLEIMMGAMPRGSYCRDPLETSRLIDLYSLLGVPLCIQLAYPSADGPDSAADQEMQVGAGYWHEGVTPAAQA